MKVVRNFNLHINKRIHLILRVRAGIWSFRGIWAVVVGSEKIPRLDGKWYHAPSVPRSCEGFYCQYPEILARNGKDQSILTADIHTPVRAKHVEGPVGIQKQ